MFSEEILKTTQTNLKVERELKQANEKSRTNAITEKFEMSGVN